MLLVCQLELMPKNCISLSWASLYYWLVVENFMCNWSWFFCVTYLFYVGFVRLSFHQGVCGHETRVYSMRILCSVTKLV